MRTMSIVPAGGLAVVLSVAMVLPGCSGTEQAGTGGDAARGRLAIERYGCGGCHTIPGIEGARARVGPALGGIAIRATLAGGAANTRDNLERWIREPQEVKPGTPMPDLGVGESQARDIVAYLYSLD